MLSKPIAWARGHPRITFIIAAPIVVGIGVLVFWMLLEILEHFYPGLPDHPRLRQLWP